MGNAWVMVRIITDKGDQGILFLPSSSIVIKRTANFAIQPNTDHLLQDSLQRIS